MSEKTSVINDVDGYIIINMYGTEYVSNEPLNMIDGKFRASDVEELIFTKV